MTRTRPPWMCLPSISTIHRAFCTAGNWKGSKTSGLLPPATEPYGTPTLSPGNYTLKVRSILLDNQQILEEREIQILVERPFYTTFWAFLIYALFIYRSGIRLPALSDYQARTKNFGRKINFFTHAAHDIRTPLTMIKAPLSEIMEKGKSE